MTWQTFGRGRFGVRQSRVWFRNRHRRRLLLEVIEPRRLMSGGLDADLAGVSDGLPALVPSQQWSIAAVSGDGQSSQVGVDYGLPLVVKVTDPATGAGVVGMQVRFESESISILSVNPTWTDAHGMASVFVRAGLSPGLQTVYASLDTGESTRFGLYVEKAQPVILVVGGTWTYDAKPHAARAIVSGSNGELLDGAWITYFEGTSASGTALAGAPVDAGVYTALVQYPGNESYSAATVTSRMTIRKAAQTLQWSAPGAIVYGAPLGEAELNAVATGVAGGSAPGQLTYEPAPGTILPAGMGQVLTVRAEATRNYLEASLSVSIDVHKATLWVIAEDVVKAFDGAATTGFEASILGFVAGDDATVLTGELTFGGDAVGATEPGEYRIVPGGLSAANYEIEFVEGRLLITETGATFDSLSAPTIVLGTQTTPVGGLILRTDQAATGRVEVTLGGATHRAEIDAFGRFLATFETSNLPIGAHTITFRYVDNATGAEVAASTRLTVRYELGIGFDPDRAHQSGSAIPLAFRLLDAAGANVGSPGLPITSLELRGPAGNLVSLLGPGASEKLKFDRGSGMYRLLLKTRGFASGRYTISFQVGDDPTRHELGFVIR